MYEVDGEAPRAKAKQSQGRKTKEAAEMVDDDFQKLEFEDSMGSVVDDVGELGYHCWHVHSVLFRKSLRLSSRVWPPNYSPLLHMYCILDICIQKQMGSLFRVWR